MKCAGSDLLGVFDDDSAKVLGPIGLMPNSAKFGRVIGELRAIKVRAHQLDK